MISRTAMALCLTAMLAGCDNQSDNYSYKTEYLPVQLAGSQRWSILDVNTGEVIARDAFTQAPSPVISGMFYVADENGTYNYYNVSAPTQAVNATPYGSVTVFSDDGLAVASKRGGPLCVIDKQCNVVKELPKDVAQCSMFSRGVAVYQNDLGLWGYINTKGDAFVSAKYSQANLFMNDDLAVVVEDHQDNDSTLQYQVVDKKGETLFSADVRDYSVIQPYFVNGVLPVVKHTDKKDTVVCLNAKGEEVPSPVKDPTAVEKAGYKNYNYTAGGVYVVVDKNNKMGVVDHDNNVMVPVKYERLTDLRRDRYIFGKDSLYSLIDDKGNAVGNAKFTHAHGGTENIYAGRGFVDVQLAAASMMTMLGHGSCAGATTGSTLMDMNGLLGDNAEPYAGQNGIAISQGPFIVRYVFDSPVATKENDSAAASYNLDAHVLMVDISLNVAHCGLNTEADIVGHIQSAMGTKGLVLDNDGLFVNDMGHVVSLGYSQGIVGLCYFIDPSLAKPLPRTPRK